MHTSKSVQPPLIFSASSGPPTSSAPAALASSILSPLAKTTTRSDLPMPCGSTIEPRTNWSACLGSIPSRIAISTVWSNFVVLKVFNNRHGLGHRQRLLRRPAPWPAWPSFVLLVLASLALL